MVSPTWSATVCTASNLVKGSFIRLNMDCSGKKPIIASVVSPSNNFHRINPLAMPSNICQIIKNPRANAERFTRIPKNKQKEKKPISFTKNARINSKSENIMENLVKVGIDARPRIKETMKTKSVDIYGKRDYG